MENEYLKPYFDNTERLENLSYAIGYYRKEKGLSQEQLAEKLGISRQHLAAVEAPRMNRGLSLELLFNIASVLEIEPYLLLKFRLQNDSSVLLDCIPFLNLTPQKYSSPAVMDFKNSPSLRGSFSVRIKLVLLQHFSSSAYHSSRP